MPAELAKNASDTGGGSATHAGANYQNYVAAWLAVQILAEKDVTPPWDLPAEVTLESIDAETPNPIDDLAVRTSAGGRALLQAKHTVSLATTANSPLGSTLGQFVEEYLAPEANFDPERDRFVLVTGLGSPATLRSDLPAFLNRIRASPNPEAEWTTVNERQRNAANVFRNHILREWRSKTATEPLPADFMTLVRLIRVHILDVDPNGKDLEAAKNTLRQRILTNPAEADAAWNTLVTTSGTNAANHHRADRASLQNALAAVGHALQAQRSYRADIECLKKHTSTTIETLAHSSCIYLGTSPITIRRSATVAAQDAASQGNLLILGIPGAGKSGAVYDIAKALVKDNADVVLFAADQLEARSAGALRAELGITQELPGILAAWPGTTPGYLIIDALDAARSSAAGDTLHATMRRVISANGRWRVIASVRKFDLRYNRKLQELFSGPPPIPHSDSEFSKIRHVNVSELTDAELDQFARQSPALQHLFATSPPPLKELMRVPFNLRLLTDLLNADITAAELQPLTSQIELLDRYWQERIVRTDGEGDAREHILRLATKAMVHQRELRVRRDELSNEIAASSVIKDLLSTHVLAELTMPSGVAKRDFVKFPHQILFEYAVAKLVIPRDRKALIGLLRGEPELLLTIRPSIELHYQRLWHEDPEEFWNLTFRTIRADLRAIGKLVGPSVAALQARNVGQYRPLLDKLSSHSPADHEEGIGALHHALSTLVAHADSGTVRATPWCSLIDALSAATMTSEIAAAIRPSVWFLSERADALTASERNHLGAAARRLLTHALSNAPDDYSLLTVAITAVTKTAATDPEASIALLRSCITPAQLKSIGYRTLHFLANGTTNAAAIDPIYVRDLYVAAIHNQDRSRETTPLGESRIIGFTSSRQDQYNGGLYALGQNYPEFLQRAPGPAVAALLGVLAAFAREHSSVSDQRLAVRLGDLRATLVPDWSYIWEPLDSYQYDLPIVMLSHFVSRLRTLGDENNSAAIECLLNELAAAPVPAVVWRKLLIAGALRPTGIGRYLDSLAWDSTILTSQDTQEPGAKFVRALYPSLSRDERERVELAILSIPKDDPAGKHNRDRLLGCLDPRQLVSQQAIQQYAELTAQGGLPSDTETYTGRGVWEQLHTPRPIDALQEFLDPVAAFISQNINTVPSAAAVASAIPHLEALRDAIAAPAQLTPKELETRARTELLFATTVVARAHGLAQTQRVTLLRIVIDESTRAAPNHGEATDEERAPDTWKPRCHAAETAMLLARYPSVDTAQLLEAIERLSMDPVPDVRAQIARRLRWLLDTGPDFFWGLLEKYSTHEQDSAVLEDVLKTLRLVPFEHSKRVASLAERILNRTPATADYKGVRGECACLFLFRALHAADATSIAALDRLIGDPATHTYELQCVILCLSGEFTAAESTMRDQAFILTQRSLSAIIAAMKEIEAGNKDVRPWPAILQERFQGLLHCASEIAFRLFSTSGAFKHQDPESGGRSLPAHLFYPHAKPILDQLADIGNPAIAHRVLETLVHFIATDPQGVLIIAGRVVRKGTQFGYQYELPDLVVDMIRQYLAEYRSVLRTCNECLVALMDILDAFVSWPQVRQLIYQADEIYR